jgi:hypothetical protein
LASASASPEQLAGSFAGNGAGRQDLERYVMAEGLANHLEEPPMSAILGRTLKQVNVGVFCAFPA